MMKSLEYIKEQNILEARINDTTVNVGQKIIVKNPVYPDKPDWELTFIEKDGKDKFRGTNIYGMTVTVPIANIKEIIPLPKVPKKREMSSEQIKKIKYQIADLESELVDIMRDMENDPEVIDERGAGGPATNKYGIKMNKIQSKIDKLYDKLQK